MKEEVIVGTLEAIYFENPSNLYKVIRVSIDDEHANVFTDSEIVCTGQFATLHFDTLYEFYGQFTHHSKYGEQFAVTRYQQKAPTTEQGLVDYLSSNRFVGIGKVLAERIVEKLGMNAIELIIEDIDTLKQVKGLTEQKRVSLRESILKYQGTERVFMQLSEWGFSPKIADKIYQEYKSTAIEKIKENPYELVEKIDSISFAKADLLAEQLGFEPDSIERIMAGYYTAVSSHCNQNGDTYLIESDCIEKNRQLLESSRPFLLTDELLSLALEKAILEERLMRISESIMIPSLYYAEIGITEKIYRHLAYAQHEMFEDKVILQSIEEIIELTQINYDQMQQSALKLAINSPLSIITGGPGTGKTTLVKGLIALHATLHEYDLSDVINKPDFTPILLAAPTGRAAKRMNEMTGLPAMTIHRLLGFNRDSQYEDFEIETTLDGKLLIIDEMSMVDTWLMNWLMQAIPYGMQVVLVGDKDQLPSVGPGKVFSDLIESKALPTIQLEKIYRQGQDSTIVDLAHAIRKGTLPENFLQKQPDRSFIPCQPHQVADVVQNIVSKAQAKQFNATSLQVLAPMYKGEAGINQLNRQLQLIMNPPKKGKREIQYFEHTFRVGDKVLQLINNTEADVYNGDIGKIVAIIYAEEADSNVEEIIVAFDDKEIPYKRSDLDQLTLAYCCSIHKSQGSEYPLVILPLVDMYSRMLRKDLLYTAVTRAKKSLVLVGNPQSFYKAATSATESRATLLKELLDVKLKMKVNTQEKSTSLTQNSDEFQTSERTDSCDFKTGKIEHLTNDTVFEIDPMIGMEGITPYDFM